jgi:Ser/Thr protein kinase RdoA (MazF antagonist)
VGSSIVPDGVNVEELLLPWQLTAPDFAEIEHRRRASRTWWVESLEGRFVAKLTFDGRRFVEPGLRVAAAVALAGVPTGPPVITHDGDVCVEVNGPSRPWTVALLRAVGGKPLVPTEIGAEQVAGDLLGRVHAHLGECSRREWVPADLLEWSAEFAATTANTAASTVVDEISAVRDLVRFSVVYGDPSPEILVDVDGTVGLIDWGTPSWGPQLHDVAAWLRWLGEEPGSGSPRETRFLQSYSTHARLTSVDLSLLPVFGRYGAAFGFIVR